MIQAKSMSPRWMDHSPIKASPTARSQAYQCRRRPSLRNLLATMDPLDNEDNNDNETHELSHEVPSSTSVLDSISNVLDPQEQETMVVLVEPCEDDDDSDSDDSLDSVDEAWVQTVVDRNLQSMPCSVQDLPKSNNISTSPKRRRRPTSCLKSSPRSRYTAQEFVSLVTRSDTVHPCRLFLRESDFTDDESYSSSSGSSHPIYECIQPTSF